MGQNIRSSRGRFGSRTPGRVLSGPEVQPAEMPAPLAPTGLPAGRVPATKVAASGVAASAPVLRLCGREETDHRQQDRKDARRSHKEGNSSGHGLPTQGIRLYFTPGRWSGALCKCRYRLQGSGVFGGIPVSASRLREWECTACASFCHYYLSVRTESTGARAKFILGGSRTFGIR